MTDIEASNVIGVDEALSIIFGDVFDVVDVGIGLVAVVDVVVVFVVVVDVVVDVVE